MKIHHIALWVNDLEKMRGFYTTYFATFSNEKYINPVTGFESYFLSFQEGGCKIELMTRGSVHIKNLIPCKEVSGLAHFSVSMGSLHAVEQLVLRLRYDGYQVSDPRWTGDGYYESVVLDPEGNKIEITI